jgi:hypothetical protein
LRSVLVGREFALAYHPTYYQQIQQRAIDTVLAQYSEDLAITNKIIEKYGINFFLIDRNAFTSEYLLKQEWLINSSFSNVIKTTIEKLKAGEIPALQKLSDRCSVVSTEKVILLEANCIKEAT